MHTIRRDEDDEIMGYVVPVGDHWQATTVFNAALADPTSLEEAEDIVRRDGLSCLTDRWLVEYQGEWREARLQEVRPDSVRLWWADPMIEQSPHGQWIDTRAHKIRRV
ncbi:hypothetical protein [Kibdelosporangium aridum]|uniref:hypothetical protein n=1 Tax=Kibdelosporangium aridum TaxID=2030 RepID=UPI000524BE5E